MRRTVLVVAAVILGAAFVTFAVLALTGRDSGESPSPSASASAGASSSPSPTPSTSASPSDEPSPSPTPSEPSGPLEVAWEPVSEFPPHANVRDVSFVDGRWFAVGEVYPDAAIWTSDDGRSWTRSQIDAIDGGDERVVATGLAAIGDTLVAIGRFGAANTDQMAWVTWTSGDGGMTWTESRDGPTSFAPHAIVAGGPGLVAAGWEYAGTVPFDSWVAVSEDGTAWDRPASDVGEYPGQLAYHARRAHRGCRQPGRRVRAPTRPAGTRTMAAARGRRPRCRAARQPETMADVIVTDEGLLAVGPGDGAHGGSAAWLSADGTAWERFTIDDVAGAVAVASVDGGFVAVGNVADELDIGAEFTWTSVDGRTWRPAVRSIPVRPFWTASAATDQRSSQAGSACRTSATRAVDRRGDPLAGGSVAGTRLAAPTNEELVAAARAQIASLQGS